MKTIAIMTSCLATWMLACGGGASTPVAQPTPQAAEEQPAAAGTGDADNEVIPDKPKPFISVSGMFRASQGVAAATPVVVAKRDADQAIERVFEMFTELAEGAAAASGDCERLAASVRTWGTRHVVELKQLMPILNSLDQSMSEAENQALEQRMQPIVLKLANAIQTCDTPDVVVAAFVEIGEQLEPEPTDAGDDKAESE